MEQGAVGFSTGSRYYPGPWADTVELVELGKAVHEAGGIYMCEPRATNLDRAHGRAGVPEALEVARQSGVRLHFAHYRTGPATAGRIDRIMEHIDVAKERGADITFDIYPSPVGSSIPLSLLAELHSGGRPRGDPRRLADPSQRAKIADSLNIEHGAALEVDRSSTYLPANQHLEGMSLRDIAAQREQSMGETLCALLLEE